MIPLYKLEKLPRIQQLRKITKIFSFAENRLCAAKKDSEVFTAAEYVFFTDAAKLLAGDALFPQETRKIFSEAAEIFAAGTKTGQLRRALNNVKHILLATTGQDQADWDFTCDNGCLDPVKRQIFEGIWVYMEDIRSPFNVGAMFRTAESFGVEKIILSSFCADPLHKRAERTAMGCVNIIPWQRQELFLSPGVIPSDQEGNPLPVFALETGGIPLTEFSFPQRGLLITGSEELGVSPNALAAADASLGRVSIPCYGAKASLNVSVAFGIAMQAWAQRIQK
jgi:TrmH family RNA methyltransferase